MKCRFCGSEDLRLLGSPSADRTGVLYQKTCCNSCGRYPSFRTEEKVSKSEAKDRPARSAKILLLDLETLPMRGFLWGLFNQNIGINQLISHTFIVSWSAKWLFEDEMYSDVLTPEEVDIQSDARICKSLWKFMDESDCIVGHNARKFDIPKANWRFLINGLPPTSPFQVIDTLRSFKKGNRFFPDSGKLDALCQELGIGEKVDTGGFELWEKCYYGDPVALQDMLNYNKHDVIILEALYLKIRPWITSHPNVGLYIEDNTTSCPHCGSTDIEWLENKPYQTSVGLYSSFRCKDCTAVGRSRTSEISKAKRAGLVTTCAR